MARRGAMGREPRAKQPALRGAARRKFKQRQMQNLPGPGGQMPEGAQLGTGGTQPVPRVSGGVTANPPRQKAMQRLSPGVYRGAEGALVGRGGRPLPPQARLMPQPGMPGIPEGFQPNKGMAPMPPQFVPDEQAPMIQGGPAPMPQPDGGWMGSYKPAIPQQQPSNLGDIFGGQMPQGPIQNGFGNFSPMPQPSANQGGKYRLSPGVYGSRDQAMRQWEMQRAIPGAVNAPGQMFIDMSQFVPQEQQQGGGGRGIANFPMDQRQREMGYVEDRFNAARNNNLFRGNPIKKLRF